MQNFSSGTAHKANVRKEVFLCIHVGTERADEIGLPYPFQFRETSIAFPSRGSRFSQDCVDLKIPRKAKVQVAADHAVVIVDAGGLAVGEQQASVRVSEEIAANAADGEIISWNRPVRPRLHVEKADVEFSSAARQAPSAEDRNRIGRSSGKADSAAEERQDFFGAGDAGGVGFPELKD